MTQISNHTHCQVAQNVDAQTKTCQRVWLPQRTDRRLIIKHEDTTMCIVHKDFRGFLSVSPASFFGGKLTGLKSALPYDAIHLPL